MKKIIALTSSLLLLLSALAGCGGTEQPGTDETDEVSGTGGESLPAESTVMTEDTTVPEIPVLVQDGKPVFNVVRPADASGVTVEGAQAVVKKIKDLSGKSPTLKDDWPMPGVDYTGESEILIGLCDRPESQYVVGKMSYDDYSIVAIGAKIVIAAHTKASLREAADYFVGHIEQKDGQTVYTGGYRFTKDPNSAYLFNESNSLRGYCIVTDTTDQKLNAAAAELAAAIRKCYGFRPEIRGILAEETEKEIYIGDTGRDECRSIGEIPDGSYRIAVAGKKIIIAGNTSALCAAGVDAFIKKHTEKYLSDTLLIEASMNYSEVYIPFEISNTLADGADIRVMSFNLLCELWDDVARSTMQDRNEKVAQILRYYSPDVVGIQEVSDMWYSRLSKYLGDEYLITDKKTPEDKTNFSTLAYNPSKVKMLDHGVQVFSQGNDRRLRLASWAVFEQLSSGKQFIVMSTHWDLGKNAEYQNIHSVEMAALALKLQEKYNLPLITTGDYNVKEESAPYMNFINTTNYREAKYAAEKKLYAGASTHAVGSNPSKADGQCIDHIFANDKVTFKFFTVIIDDYTSSASDHSPIFADIRLN